MGKKKTNDWDELRSKVDALASATSGGTPIAASVPVDEQVRLLTSENTRLRNEIAKKETGWRLLDSAIHDVYDRPTCIRVQTPKKSSSTHKEIGVLHLSDLHLGKRTRDYDISIAEQRLVSLASGAAQIIKLRQKFAAIDELVILFGGDFIENESGIFPAQPHEVDIDLLDQLIKIGPELIVNLLLSLSASVTSVRIHAVPGNHGRLTRFNSDRSNADSVFYEVVRKMLAISSDSVANRTQWDLPLDRGHGQEWYCKFPLAGDHHGFMVHGHEVRGQLGFPWYGVGKKVQGWNTTAETRGFDYFWMGHFHTAASYRLNDVHVFASGSLESSNAYALQNMASGGRPNQRLSFFNEKYGLLADHLIQL